jgi:hypothetical protein
MVSLGLLAVSQVPIPERLEGIEAVLPHQLRQPLLPVFPRLLGALDPRRRDVLALRTEGQERLDHTPAGLIK